MPTEQLTSRSGEIKAKKVELGANCTEVKGKNVEVEEITEREENWGRALGRSISGHGRSWGAKGRKTEELDVMASVETWLRQAGGVLSTFSNSQ